MTAEFAHYQRYSGLGGLDLMHARFIRHHFGQHSHESYAIGMVEAGRERIRFPGGMHDAGAGDLVLIEPGVVHTGQPYDSDGWAYRVLYPSVDQIRSIGDEIGMPRGLPSFDRRVVPDARVAEWATVAHRAAGAGQSLTADSLLCELLAFVLRMYGTKQASRQVMMPGRESLATARELLHESMPDPPNLTELAASAGVTPFTLVRAFRSAYGMPPYAYLTHLRVEEARKLLRRGMAPTEAALKVGFYDQSHLSRHFRRLVGVPPGAYQRGVL